ncbi:MAG: N-acetylmuramoyl-L-alanine amidase [Kofleriaceae bacterium]
MTDDARTKAALDATRQLQQAALDALHAAHLHSLETEPLEIDDEGILRGVGVEYIASPKRQALATPDGNIDGIVAHWTDTRGCGAANLARRITGRGGRAASWHACIDATGEIVQSVPCTYGSWHAGSDTAALFTLDAGIWTPVPPEKRGKVRAHSANAWTFGIELECVGEVRLVEADAKAHQLQPMSDWIVTNEGADRVWCGWPFRFDYRDKSGSLVRPCVVPVSEVVSAGKRHYHAFTAAQLASAKRLYAALIRRYGLLRANVEWGHDRIDPTRRTDPGPLFHSWLGTALDEIYGVS